AAEGREIGEVTSGTSSPTLGKGIGMGYVESAYAKPGTAISIIIRDKEVPATVVKPPFVKK
ncbi:MAG: glycine cleavage T C-terminal barrel domain-containing protein, partial [Candidatus Kapaibacterium sp.]